jgi:hypothetical protein
MKKTTVLSTEVQELIHYKPHWIIRKGNFLVLLLLGAILAATWLIHIPETGTISLQTSNGKSVGTLVITTDQRLFDRWFEHMISKNEQSNPVKK